MSLCKDVMTYWPGCQEEDFEYIDQSFGLFAFFRGVTQFVTLLALLVFLRRQAGKASAGHLTMQEVRQSLIFPVYVAILWALALACLGTSVVDIMRPFSCKMDKDRSLRFFMATLFGVSWGLYHLVVGGVAIMFLFRGVGGRANVLAFLCALWWAVVTAILHFFMAAYPDDEVARAGEVAWDGVLMVFFAVMTLAPATRLYRRPSAASYCRFFLFCRSVQFIGDLLIHPDINAETGHCFIALSGSGFLSIFAPYVVYRALLHDCWYWQGALANSGANESSVRDPLDGLTLEPEAARAIAMELGNAATSPAPLRSSSGGGRSSLSSAGVHLINIAELVIDYHGDELSADSQRRRQQRKRRARGRPVILGQGGSAKVYKGRWKELPVAIKMIWFTELTPADIRRFHTEALLLSQLQHPNVVQIYGVCVHPPSLCLVMELCAGGSLRQLLDNSSFPDPTQPDAMVTAARSGKSPLTLEQRLDLARQCVDAVNFLHSQDPPVLHLDLKCSNFLIDSDGVVKVSDLELSREIVRVSSKEARRKDRQMLREARQKQNTRRRRGWLSSLANRWAGRRKNSSAALLNEMPRSLDSSAEGLDQVWDTADPQSYQDDDESKMQLPGASRDVAEGLGGEDEDESDDDQFNLWFMSGAGMGQPDTINWLAPEVIAQQGCGPPSDVYSLGMVVWETLTGKVPFEDDMNLSKPKFNPDGSRVVEPQRVPLRPAVVPVVALAPPPPPPSELQVAEVDARELEQESKQRDHERRAASLGIPRTGGQSHMRSIPVLNQPWRSQAPGRAQAALSSISAALGISEAAPPKPQEHRQLSQEEVLARRRAALKASEDRRWLLAPAANRRGRSNSDSGMLGKEGSMRQDAVLRRSLLGDAQYRTFEDVDELVFVDQAAADPVAVPPDLPEHHNKDSRLRHRILREEYRPPIPEWTPMEVRALMLQMWRADPLDRPPASLVAQILGMVCEDKGVRPRAVNEFRR